MLSIPNDMTHSIQMKLHSLRKAFLAHNLLFSSSVVVACECAWARRSSEPDVSEWMRFSCCDFYVILSSIFFQQIRLDPEFLYTTFLLLSGALKETFFEECGSVVAFVVDVVAASSLNEPDVGEMSASNEHLVSEAVFQFHHCVEA